jgi:four helix bundle protein
VEYNHSSTRVGAFVSITSSPDNLMRRSFRDLVAFQRALDMVAVVYEVSDSFPRREMYGLTSQNRSAALGVVSDIAEGSGRLTFGEWRKFLSDARGSLFEVEGQAMAAQRLKFLDEAGYARIQHQISRTAAALAGLIKWVRNKERSPRQPDNLTT